jgi:hypothetical protein
VVVAAAVVVKTEEAEVEGEVEATEIEAVDEELQGARGEEDWGTKEGLAESLCSQRAETVIHVTSRLPSRSAETKAADDELGISKVVMARTGAVCSAGRICICRLHAVSNTCRACG